MGGKHGIVLPTLDVFGAQHQTCRTCLALFQIGINNGFLWLTLGKAYCNLQTIMILAEKNLT